MKQLQNFRFALALVAALGAAALHGRPSYGGHQASPEEEAKELAILRSDAAPADKALACKRLAIHGSSAAVHDLAVLLHDRQLASWARIALEAIPGPQADEALRTAAQSLQGLLLVGTINSIGVRRDALAVDQLTSYLKQPDVEVAAAAAVALGRIGNASATSALRGLLTADAREVRTAVAEGCILCAERLQAVGNRIQAVEIYDEVRKADVAQARTLEATRGAILARQQDGIPLLIEQIQSPDKALFQVALSTAREFPGSDVDKALADQLARLEPLKAVLVVEAMADRPETVVLAAVLKAAAQGPEPVRLAALRALGRVGDETCLGPLLETAQDNNPALSGAAKSSLGELPGKSVNDQIVALLPNATGKKYPVLIELVGERRIAATQLLTKALDHSDALVRSTALTSLGKTVAANDLNVLVSQVVKPGHAEDQPVAELALKAASVRMPDREACAAELVAALDRISATPTRGAMLKILAAVGGTKALAAIDAGARSSDSEIQDVSSRLLGEWMTADAAPVLLELAKTLPQEKIKVRALRGYIRIARQFDLPEAERMAMCQHALESAEQAAEKKLVLEVLKRYPTVDGLKLAVPLMRDAGFGEDAALATMAIAQKLVKSGADLKEPLAAANFEPLKIEVAKAEYGADSTWKDVTETLKKLLAGSPLAAPPGDYNTVFEGDPLPGMSKQLKVQYSMHGKLGEATFAENEVVFLPMPK